MGREKLEQMKVTIATEVERLAVDVVIGNRSPVARAAISEELNDKISWMATQFSKSTKHPLLKKHREAIQKVIWDSVVEALVDGEAKAIGSFKNGYFEGFERAWYDWEVRTNVYDFQNEIYDLANRVSEIQILLMSVCDNHFYKSEESVEPQMLHMVCREYSTLIRMANSLLFDLEKDFRKLHDKMLPAAPRPE